MAAKPSAEIVGLQKRLATAKKKLDEAKASGKPTKAVEDRIYEIEDELRLAAVDNTRPILLRLASFFLSGGTAQEFQHLLEQACL